MRIDPFELELSGADVFPRWSKPRIVRSSLTFAEVAFANMYALLKLWLGATKGKNELNYLLSELEAAWDKAGIPNAEPKRPHKTHLTVGRWSDITPDTYAADQMRNACAGVNWVTSFKGPLTLGSLGFQFCILKFLHLSCSVQSRSC